MKSLKKKQTNKQSYTYDRLDYSFIHGGQNQQTSTASLMLPGWVEKGLTLYTLSFIQKDAPIPVFVKDVCTVY